MVSLIIVICAACIGVLAAVDFNACFIVFHKLFFNNDLWILDPTEDLIINILVEPFFADMAVYPATMFFTLFIKGFEGLIAGLSMRLFARSSKQWLSVLGALISMIIAGAAMMTGYFVCNSFLYGTPASAMIALPADAVQASASAALAFTVLYGMRLIALRKKLFPPRPKESAANGSGDKSS